jgi:hypothetical protein
MRFTEKSTDICKKGAFLKITKKVKKSRDQTVLYKAAKNSPTQAQAQAQGQVESTVVATQIAVINRYKNHLLVNNN